MRKHLVSLWTGVATAALFASAASAADLPARAAPPAPVVAAAPIFTWTGFYAGVNAGWGWLNDNSTSVVLGGAVPGTLFFDNNDDGGFVGGAQIGYNYQIGSFVIGVEADLQWADTDRNIDVRFVPAGAGGVFTPGTFRSDLSDWFGTVRARVGVAFDRVLIYGTGGLAYSDNDTGWTLGAGAEWALPVNWFGSSAVTFGIEALYLNFDNDDDFNGVVGTFNPAGPAGPVNVIASGLSNGDNEFWVARAKLNFKFGTY